MIDLRTIRPMDIETVIASVKKTNRLVTVEEGWGASGVGAKDAMRVCEQAFDWLEHRPGASRARMCRCLMPPISRSSPCPMWTRWSRRRRPDATDSHMGDRDLKRPGVPPDAKNLAARRFLGRRASIVDGGLSDKCASPWLSKGRETWGLPVGSARHVARTESSVKGADRRMTTLLPPPGALRDHAFAEAPAKPSGRSRHPDPGTTSAIN